MKTMKHDMGGSAAALGTFLALSQTGNLLSQIMGSKM